MPSAEMVTAISGLVVGLGGISGTVAVARAGRRTPRQERRDDFAAVTDNLQEQISTLKADVAEQKAEVAAQKAEVAEQKAGRRQDSRTINAMVRYMRKMARALRDHDLPLPDPDPDDVLELAHHGLP